MGISGRQGRRPAKLLNRRWLVNSAKSWASRCRRVRCPWLKSSTSTATDRACYKSPFSRRRFWRAELHPGPFEQVRGYCRASSAGSTFCPPIDAWSRNWLPGASNRPKFWRLPLRIRLQTAISGLETPGFGVLRLSAPSTTFLSEAVPAGVGYAPGVRSMPASGLWRPCDRPNFSYAKRKTHSRGHAGVQRREDA